MKILYNNQTGEIYTIIPDNVDAKIRFQSYPKEALDTFAEIPYEGETLSPEDLINHVVKNNTLVIRGSIEIQELKSYGRILTDEERLRNILQPSQEEILKAKSTLEILSTLQEVGLI